MGASLAEMRATEQIDAIEALSVDSFKLLVVPRVVACFIALPLLTTFMDFCGVISGFLSEHFLSNISLQLYVSRAFQRSGVVQFCSADLENRSFRIHHRDCFMFLWLHDERRRGRCSKSRYE